jgi:hypothetical protein
MVKPGLCTCGLFAGLLSISGCTQPDGNGNEPVAPTAAARISIAPHAVLPVSSAGHATGEAGNRFYVGNWEPLSNIWQDMGDLHIDGQSGLRWYRCKTTYAEESTVTSRSGVVLALSPDSDCRLDDLPRTRVLFVRVASQPSPCEMEIAAYASDTDVQNEHPSAEGIYSRRQCGPIQ